MRTQVTASPGNLVNILTFGVWIYSPTPGEITGRGDSPTKFRGWGAQTGKADGTRRLGFWAREESPWDLSSVQRLFGHSRS